jgi:hypothetical protein
MLAFSNFSDQVEEGLEPARKSIGSRLLAGILNNGE